jgi:hypothetical protein
VRPGGAIPIGRSPADFTLMLARLPYLSCLTVQYELFVFSGWPKYAVFSCVRCDANSVNLIA